MFYAVMFYGYGHTVKLQLNEAIVYRAVFVLVSASGLDARTDGRTETLLKPAK